MLKKLISLLLVLCLCAMTLVACSKKDEDGKDKDDKKKIETVTLETAKSNPASAMSIASENAAKLFLGEYASAMDIVESAASNGSTTLHVGIPELLKQEMGDMAFDAVEGTIYAKEGKGGALELAVLSDGATMMDALMHMTKDTIAVKSEALFGTDDTYMVKIGELTNQNSLLGSVLVEALAGGEIPSDVIPAEFAAILAEVKALYGDMIDLGFDDTMMLELMDAVFGALDPEVSEVTYEVDGEDVECILISYSMDLSSIEVALGALIDAIDLPDILVEVLNQYAFAAAPGMGMTESALKEYLKTELFAALDSELQYAPDVEIAMDFYVNAANSALTAMNVTETNVRYYSPTDYWEQTVSYNVVMTDSTFALGLNMSYYDGQTVGGALTVDKTVNGDEVAYDLGVDVNASGVSVEIASGTCTYNTKSGDWALSAAVDYEDVNVSVGVSGELVISGENTVTLSLNQVAVSGDTLKDEMGVPNVTVDLDISVTSVKGEAMPVVPADATNLLSLDMAALAALGELIENSPLGSLIASSASGRSDYEHPNLYVMTPDPYWYNYSDYEIGSESEYISIEYDDWDSGEMLFVYQQMEYWYYASNVSSMEYEMTESLVGYTVYVSLPDDGGAMIWWTDGDYGYAIMSESISYGELIAIAETIYE
ncbi:MAG: DUF4367 domain-containing protein [Clostridia bacterium]|nr:DUF4367 domain-containing protein [Clostridia bacterium]